MRRSSGRKGLIRVAVGLAMLGVPPTFGQISPGELSRAHADLEGSAHCLDCHEARRGVAAELCLSCHGALERRILSQRGLHAQPGHEACETCHIEHHGREFELVYWGEKGIDGFAHALTGYPLEGAHVRASCRACHQPAFHAANADLEGANPESTFLGLDSSCRSCHVDVHGGEFASDPCSRCHSFEDWQHAPGFDHTQTAFPLTGRHVDVGCDSCHRRSDTLRSFAVERFTTCTDCHQNPHRFRVQARCEECHSTSGWGRVDTASLDHDQTRFALRGAHRRVSCSSCHVGGRRLRFPAFGSCSDCHRDPHRGEFSTGSHGGDCGSCHTDESFRPSTFTVLDHRSTGFPLEGHHRAVPCSGCHGESTGAGDGRQLRFRFVDTSCSGCHEDPHRGEVERFADRGGCEHCHSLAGWAQVSFDHAETGFPLRGGHSDVGCRECHQDAAAGSQPGVVGFTLTSARCSDCHPDPHLGQFDRNGRAADCDRCHQVTTWSELSFDHQRDSSFVLRGAHQRAGCEECHRVESVDGHNVVRYRPVPSGCADCHS